MHKTSTETPPHIKVKVAIPFGSDKSAFLLINTIINDGSEIKRWHKSQNQLLENNKLVHLDVGMPFVFSQNMVYGSLNNTGVTALKNDTAAAKTQYSKWEIL